MKSIKEKRQTKSPEQILIDLNDGNKQASIRSYTYSEVLNAMEKYSNKINNDKEHVNEISNLKNDIEYMSSVLDKCQTVMELTQSFVDIKRRLSDYMAIENKDHVIDSRIEELHWVIKIYKAHF